jgi:hypothetical protein
MVTAVVAAVGNVEKAERFLRSFFQVPRVKSATFFRGFPQVRIFHSASRPTIFRFPLGWESLTRIVPATNQLHQPVRRLGMDFRAETTRFGPTSHTQMPSEFHTQDSTIGPAQD